LSNEQLLVFLKHFSPPFLDLYFLHSRLSLPVTRLFAALKMPNARHGRKHDCGLISSLPLFFSDACDAFQNGEAPGGWTTVLH
jgi:hypothetical protein